MSSPKPLKQARAAATREKLLDAAAVVAQNRGLAEFTLENVAEQAGVSKGGLLYHFASKDELIVGLLDQTLRATEIEIENRVAELGAGPGSFAIAYLDYVREPNRPEVEFASSLLAAAASKTDLLGNARESFAGWSERLMTDDGISRSPGLLARVVSEGLWLMDLFGLAPPTAGDRADVLDVVIAMIEADAKS